MVSDVFAMICSCVARDEGRGRDSRVGEVCARPGEVGLIKLSGAEGRYKARIS